MTPEPRLSIVAVSRNDGHGENITKRMRLFVNGLLHQTRKFNLPAELIIVEWNPPADRPLLQEILPKPTPDDLLRLRYIIVPPEVHNTYKRGKKIPLFQMIGKNVGIRRAKAPFVLCTNIDLIFSDVLMAKLASGNLDPNTYYRANRVDVTDGIEESWSFAQQIAYCENPKNVLKRLGRDARLKNLNAEMSGHQHRPYYQQWLLDKLTWSTGFLRSKVRKQLYLLDTYACGDFTLMSKDAWEDIQGYAELDLYSIHVDSLGIIAAAARGYRQHIFPRTACAYHIDHSQGWEAMTPMEKIKFSEERPGLGYGVVWETGIYAIERGIRLDLNAEDWGFRGMEFEEFGF